MTKPLETNELGSSGLHVTQLGLGGGPIGGLFADISEDTAVRTIQRGLQLGVHYFDTAPLYGHGKSERYYGRALAGVHRDDFVLSTKVGRVLEPTNSPPQDDSFHNLPNYAPVFDFSREGVLRSLDESLERLNLDRVDIAIIHDPDEGESTFGHTFGEPVHYRQAVAETYPALAELRSQGVLKAIGVGMNQWQALVRFANDADFDCLMVAGRYTLLDQSALTELLPLCQRKGISVVLGGAYNSGILASNLSEDASYFYAKAPPEVLDRARQIKAVCDRHAVPLKAAALQFCLAHPAVAAVLTGVRSVAEVEDNVRMLDHPTPTDLWAELRHKELIPSAAPTPSGG